MKELPVDSICHQVCRKRKKCSRVMSSKLVRWKGEEEQVKYVPLQAKEGDLAIFLLSGATEVIYENEKYFIVPQSAILMLEREEDL